MDTLTSCTCPSGPIELSQKIQQLTLPPPLVVQAQPWTLPRYSSYSPGCQADSPIICNKILNSSFIVSFIFYLHLSAFSCKSASSDIFSSKSSRLDWVLTLSVRVTLTTLGNTSVCTSTQWKYALPSTCMTCGGGFHFCWRACIVQLLCQSSCWSGSWFIFCGQFCISILIIEFFIQFYLACSSPCSG